MVWPITEAGCSAGILGGAMNPGDFRTGPRRIQKPGNASGKRQGPSAPTLSLINSLSLLNLCGLVLWRTVPAQQLRKVLRKSGARQDHVATHFMGLLLQITL